MNENGVNLTGAIEAELQANNNKLSPEFVKKVVAECAEKFVIDGGHTFCMLTMPTGHICTGDASVIDYQNNDIKIGMDTAKEKAVKKVWETLGIIAKLYI